MALQYYKKKLERDIQDKGKIAANKTVCRDNVPEIMLTSSLTALTGEAKEAAKQTDDDRVIISKSQ